MPKRTVRSIVIVVLLSIQASGAAAAPFASAGRVTPLFARLLIFIHSRLGPPVGTPAPEPAAATETAPSAAQPKN